MRRAVDLRNIIVVALLLRLTHLYQRHELIRFESGFLLVFVSESIGKGGFVVADVLAQLERDPRALSLVRGVVE